MYLLTYLLTYYTTFGDYRLRWVAGGKFPPLCHRLWLWPLQHSRITVRVCDVFLLFSSQTSRCFVPMDWAKFSDIMHTSFCSLQDTVHFQAPFSVEGILTHSPVSIIHTVPVRRLPSYGMHPDTLHFHRPTPYQVPRLVAWHSDRTSVSGRRTFPVLRSTCSWWVTTSVGKPSATGQPTRPTQPFILSGSINE